MKQIKQLDIEKIRNDFPILSQKVNGKNLIYLDNSATSQKPQKVIDAITEYYKSYNSNVHRAIHSLGEKATLKFEEAHEKVAKFINAEKEEIIFTRNTTESLNLLAYSLGKNITSKDNVVITEMEHHSNIIPWQQLCKRTGAELRYIKIDKEGKLDLKNTPIDNNTKIVSIAHVSNVLGTINPVKEIANIAHKNKALFIVDGAQSVPHIKVDVKDIEVDFLAFSGHKMLGPTGIGVLYGKKEYLKKMNPVFFGGGMISNVTKEDAQWADIPNKFEAGTPNIEGAIALASAIEYLENLGMDSINSYVKDLTTYAMKKLLELNNITIYGPENGDRTALISFNLIGIHPHDVAQLLDKEGIAVRAGHMCAKPLMQVMDTQSVCRASFYFYNTKQEVDFLADSLKKVQGVFK
ncbi:cysteine desulfurase [Candidatus Woesearchaeota archaeon]|nr:cysteine desulfurase [Candidatus Woesearchaeota archaeon]